MPETKKKAAARKRKLTPYTSLIKKKAAHCKGKTTAGEVRKAATKYIKDAVKKGNKTKAQATAAAAKVLKRGCAAGIAGKKKPR